MRKLVGLSFGSASDEPDALARISGILIGRGLELATLREAFSLVSEGKTVLVHVRGEPGIGKNRARQNTSPSKSARSTCTLLAGRCMKVTSYLSTRYTA